MISLSRDVRGALRQRQRGFIINPFRYGSGGGGGDPNWASRTSLLPMQGPNNSTTITDLKSPVWTAQVGAKLSTAQSRWGGSSLLLASGDYVSTPDSSDWDFGSGDFFGETSIYIPNISGVKTILAQWGTATSDRAFIVYVNNATFTVGIYNGSSTNSASANGVTANTWYDVSWGRDGNTLAVWLNGTKSGTTANVTGVTIPNRSNTVRIGLDNNLSSPYVGHIGPMRIGKLTPPPGNYTFGQFPSGP